MVALIFYSVLAAALSSSASVAEQLDSDALQLQSEFAEYAGCLVKGQRKKVEAFLAADPFAEKAVEIGRRMTLGVCGGKTDLVFDAEALRGALYEALYRADFSTSQAIDLKNAPQLDYSSGPNASYYRRNKKILAELGDVPFKLRVFGDCVVRQDPAGARALVLSQFGGFSENHAFQQLAPAMSACIVPGDTLTLKKPLVRAVISETLYRLTAAAAGRPALVDRK